MSTPKAAADVQFHSIVPQFAVPDVIAAAEYYRDVFGFQILGYFLDPPIYAIVCRGAVTIHFGKLDEGAKPAPNILRREDSIDAYIWVNDLDALDTELQTRGANVVQPPTHQVYNSYEMVVADPWGFRLAIGMSIASEPGSSSRP
jgi:predicted enzyme related to lactoylglutathione lyase